MGKHDNDLFKNPFDQALKKKPKKRDPCRIIVPYKNVQYSKKDFSAMRLQGRADESDIDRVLQEVSESEYIDPRDPTTFCESASCVIITGVCLMVGFVVLMILIDLDSDLVTFGDPLGGFSILMGTGILALSKVQSNKKKYIEYLKREGRISKRF